MPQEQYVLPTSLVIPMAKVLHKPSYVGGVVTAVGKFRFICPMCGNVAYSDDAYGLMCTGPSTTDDHEFIDMDLQGKTT